MNRAITSVFAAVVATAGIVGADSLATPAPPHHVKSEPVPAALAFRSRTVPPKPKTTPQPKPTMARKHIPAPKPAPKPTRTTPKPAAPQAIVISHYAYCGWDGYQAQRCIDQGLLTRYMNKVLAGHNTMGWQWLSRVPVGRTLRVTSGPLAGTYRVYGHRWLGRQGGLVSADFWGADLVLQACEGSGTGFSLARRI